MYTTELIKIVYISHLSCVYVLAWLTIQLITVKKLLFYNSIENRVK